jgi:hypothetical protein
MQSWPLQADGKPSSSSVRRPGARPCPSRCLRRSRSILRRAVDDALHGLVDVEIAGTVGDAAADLAACHRRRRCCRGARRLPAMRNRPSAIEPVGLVGLKVLPASNSLRGSAEVIRHGVDFGLADDALVDQLLAVELAASTAGRGSSYISGCVNDRVVAFVVAEAAIAEHVDDDVLVELLRNSVATLAA